MSKSATFRPWERLLLAAAILVCIPEIFVLILNVPRYAAESAGYDCTNQCIPRHPDDRIALFTLWLSVFTGMLTAGTLFLWWETRGARKATERDLRIVERGYLFPSINKIQKFDEGKSWTRFKVEIDAANSGKTPVALREAFVRVLKVQPLPDIPDYPASTEYLKKYDHIVPGGGAEQHVRDVIINGTDDFILYGYIKYLDMFEVEHFSRFCLKISGVFLKHDPPEIRGEIAGSAAWNSWA